MSYSVRRTLGLTVAATGIAGLAFWSIVHLKRDNAGDAARLVAAGLSAHQAGDYPAAIEFFDRALAADSDHLPALHARAAARYGVNELEAALLDYQQILTSAPGDREARFRMAKALLGLRRETEMFEVLDGLLEIAPHHGAARRLRAWVRFNRREYAASLADLDLLIDDASMRAAVPLADILPLRVEARLSIGDDQGALDDLARLQELGGDAESIRRAQVWALWGRQQYTDALEILDEMTSADPRGATGLLAHALTLMFVREDDRARAALRQIRSAHGQPPAEADFFLWIAHMRAGDRQAATRDFRSDESFSEWQAMIAEFLRGEVTEAQLLAAAAPGDLEGSDHRRECEAFYYAGMTRLFSGDLEGGAEFLRRCVATGVRRYYEFHAATAELLRLEQGRTGDR